MTRLRAPASTYMKEYFDNNKEGKDLGYWSTFERQLVAIYGQRDTTETAKKEITDLWSNKELAKKDFVKYCEKYRTLARLVKYEDNIHIDKITDVIPQDLRQATIPLRLAKLVPKDWEEYLEILLSTYKELHPEKAKGSIFGDGNTNKDNHGVKNDSANASKGKGKEANSQQVVAKFCQICAGKGLTNKAKRHNTADCWDKPGNEHKRPAPRTTMSSSSSSSSNGNNYNKGKKKTLKVRQLFETFGAKLEEALESDDDGAASPAAAVNVNSATIAEIVDPTPGETPAIAQVDDAPKGPSRPNHGQNRRGRAQMDFPEGL